MAAIGADVADSADSAVVEVVTVEAEEGEVVQEVSFTLPEEPRDSLLLFRHAHRALF